jgi:two-component system cell cycle response regulator
MRELRAWYRNRLAARILALEAARSALALRVTEAVTSLRRMAHQLRGSGATYGFPEISESARALEEAPDGELLGPVNLLLDTLRKAAESTGEDRASILIVEDDLDLAGYLTALLSGPGREIHLAHTGAQAQAILEKHEVSLILLDLILPDTDGRSLLMKLRERLATAAIPVVVVTVKSAAQARAECMALGADEYLEKPVCPEALQAAVLGRLRAGSDIVREFRRDPLTGLPNRAAFHEAFDRARYVASAPGEPLSVGLIDIDHFELVNEACGRSLGDQVLRRVAAAIAKSLGSSDFLARWGGEEFAVLFPNAAPAAAAGALNQALQALRGESFPVGEGRTLQVTFSAGVAAAPPGMNAEEALAEADRRLYLAKQSGLDRVVSSEDKLEVPRRKILIAEDDEMIRVMIQRLLEREGFEVTTCNDGSAALASAYENSYSMILSDILMPKLDGFGLLERLRECPEMEQTPVVMLTSMGKDQDVHRGFELGASDYIVKPFSSSELLSRVRRLLKKAS